MSANQADFPITAMAPTLGVLKAGYYAWAGRQLSARRVADAALLKRIRTVHLRSHETYGAPRVHADLREQGERHCRKRVARLMREAGLVGASHRRYGEHWAVLASLIETCKLVGVQQHAYLTDVITRIVEGHPQRRLDELLPWAYPARLALRAVA